MLSVKEPDSDKKNVDISAASAKLLLFYLEDPQGWFLQAEAQFGICRVTSNKSTTSMSWLSWMPKRPRVWAAPSRLQRVARNSWP